MMQTNIALFMALMAIFTNTQHYLKNLITLEIMSMILVFLLMVTSIYKTLMFFLVYFFVLSLSGAVIAFSLITHMSSYWGTDQTLVL